MLHPKTIECYEKVSLALPKDEEYTAYLEFMDRLYPNSKIKHEITRIIRFTYPKDKKEYVIYDEKRIGMDRSGIIMMIELSELGKYETFDYHYVHDKTKEIQYEILFLKENIDLLAKWFTPITQFFIRKDGKEEPVTQEQFMAGLLPVSIFTKVDDIIESTLPKDQIRKLTTGDNKNNLTQPTQNQTSPDEDVPGETLASPQQKTTDLKKLELRKE